MPYTLIMIQKKRLRQLVTAFLAACILCGVLSSVGEAAQIEWHGWDAKTFTLAEEKDQPLLLFLKANWCHWCHEMEQTTYADAAVINMVNEWFIPVQVDTDARPDINERYNMGGWPTTCFLTPEGDIIMGATFLNPREMENTLRKVRELYRARKREIIERTQQFQAEVEAEVAQHTSVFPGHYEVVLGKILALATLRFDHVFGGFDTAPKIPQPAMLALAALEYERTREERWLRMIIDTLDHRLALYDFEFGGFHRYAETRDWHSPQYEKLLPDNARLLTNYLWGFQLTGNLRYKLVAQTIVEYLRTFLARRGGGWYASQEADLRLPEGSTPLLPATLYYEQPKAKRKELGHPLVDETLYTDWNAIAVSAHLEAFKVLGDEGAKRFAIKTLDLLRRSAYVPGRGVHHVVKGNDSTPRFLADHVYFFRALLDAYEVTGNEMYVRDAMRVRHLLKTVFESPYGAFYDVERHDNMVGHLKDPALPLVENAVLAQTLLKMARLTGKDTYTADAERILAYFIERYDTYGLAAAYYGVALFQYMHAPVLIKVVEGNGSKATQELLYAALRSQRLWKVVQLIDRRDIPDDIAAQGFPLAREPQAYICIGNSYQPPFSDPQALNMKVHTALALLHE